MPLAIRPGRTIVFAKSFAAYIRGQRLRGWRGGYGWPTERLADRGAHFAIFRNVPGVAGLAAIFFTSITLTHAHLAWFAAWVITPVC